MKPSLFSRNLTLSDIEEWQRQRYLIEDEQRNFKRSADEACYNLDKALNSLEQFTRELLTDGIAIVTHSIAISARTLSVDPIRFANRIQHEAERPLVLMQEKNAGRIPEPNGTRIWGHWVLTMPTSGSMNNLVAPLLMQSTPITSLMGDTTYYSESELPASIYHQALPRSWVITFLTDHAHLGSKAEDIRQGWLSMCKEDNLLRGCLNVPPVPVDMSDYR